MTAIYGGDTDYASASSGTLHQVVHPDTYRTTLGLVPASVGYGAENTAAATVSGASPGAAMPTGSVVVSDNASPSAGTCTVTLAGGTGSCSIIVGGTH